MDTIDLREDYTPSPKKGGKHRIFVWALVIFFALYFICMSAPRFDNYKGLNPMLKDGELPILVAHGGGNREFPDNTLEAFYNAYSVDSKVMMETDVSITKDGVVILSHDTTIDRKTNAQGKIIDWNYADLISQEVDFGYTNQTNDNEVRVGDLVKFTTDDGATVTPQDVDYPQGVTARHESKFLATTLEELLVAFPNNRISVEIKQSGETGKKALDAVIELVEKYDAFDRVVFASFHSEIFKTFKKYVRKDVVPDNFMYSPTTGGVASFYILQLLNLDLFYGSNISLFQIPMKEYGFKLATRSFVSKAHRHNLAVHFWTINDIDDMKYLIEIGADGIMTDYPHRLKQVYESLSAN